MKCINNVRQQERLGVLAVRDKSSDCVVHLSSGTNFSILDPNINDIKITDIAHNLSHLCRFNGATSEFYSVAEHSVLVSQNCNPESALHGLLHDASEGMGLGDILSPLKRTSEFTVYREIENRIQSMIYNKFGLESKEPKDVKIADLRILATEIRDLMPGSSNWGELLEPYAFKIAPLSPKDAKQLFLNRFKELTGNKYV